MTNYTNVKVRISEDQKDKLKKEFESNCQSITIRLTFADLHGEDDIDGIQEMLTAEIDKRNKLSTKYDRRVNIIGVIDNCLDATAIVLGTTGIGLLSTIVAAPAVIRVEAVSIVMGLLQVVGNRSTTMLSLKI